VARESFCTSDPACKFSHKREFILGGYVYGISASADPLRELICILDSQQMGVFICLTCTDHKVSATLTNELF